MNLPIGCHQGTIMVNKVTSEQHYKARQIGQVTFWIAIHDPQQIHTLIFLIFYWRKVSVHLPLVGINIMIVLVD